MKKPYEKPVVAHAGCLSRITSKGTVAKPGSDRRLKTGIRRFAGRIGGLPVYVFRYAGNADVFAGVMSDDVRKVRADAVETAADGYDRVDYTALGLSMVQVR